MKIEPLPLFDRIKSALRLEPMSRNELVLLLDVPKLPLIEATQILEARGEIRRLGKSKLWVNMPAAKVRASRRLVADTTKDWQLRKIDPPAEPASLTRITDEEVLA